MQMHGSQHRSVVTCARTVFRNEGLSAFYVSYPTTLMMTVPFTAVQFTVYEYVKRILNPKNEYSPISHITAGGMAGAVAAGVTTPLDVAKTLLQTRGTSQDADIRNARGIVDAVKIIFRRDGLKGFARGLSPRMLTHMPSNALCWASYEFFSKSSSCFGRQHSDVSAFNRGGYPRLGRWALAPLLSLYLNTMSRHTQVCRLTRQSCNFFKLSKVYVHFRFL